MEALGGRQAGGSGWWWGGGGAFGWEADRSLAAMDG